MMSGWRSRVAACIADRFGLRAHLADWQSVGGGSINDAYRLTMDGHQFFVKCHRAEKRAMFEAEFAGLAELAGSQAVRVPEPYEVGSDDERAWIVLEWIDRGIADAHAAAALGDRLAAMHAVTRESYGWKLDNTIGLTPQPNGWMDDWLEFWRTRRLGYQLDLALDNGIGARLHEPGWRLLENLGAFFDGYRPVASLLHGDLWGGNWFADSRGQPVIFDPAVYYGDRESDLAMSELFGGFPAEFYEAYRASWPLDAGYAVRRELYQLYHVLNHANLFGGGYVRQAESMIARLLAACRA